MAFDGERLDLEVVNRFTHSPRSVDGVLRWDIDTLWGGVQEGLGALSRRGGTVASVGVDAWGVDYGLVDPTGALVDAPTCYRDPRQTVQHRRALAAVGPERLYAATGAQIMPINTLFALMSDAATMPQRLERAETLLMLPDVFHHLLSGTRATEFTAASTTGFFDMARGRWATGLLDELGVPTHLLPEVVPPGTDVGPLLGDLATRLPRRGPRDRSARATTPRAPSSARRWPTPTASTSPPAPGHWSASRRRPRSSPPRPRRATSPTKAGMPARSGCCATSPACGCCSPVAARGRRRARTTATPSSSSWPAGRTALVSIVNPDAPEFLDGQDMPTRIQQYCAATGSRRPARPRGRSSGAPWTRSPSATAPSSTTSRRSRATAIPSVNITGGGSNNALLSQLTADSTGLPVHCGPVEATALGNAATQLVALGELSDLDDIRRVVSRTTALTTYTPHHSPSWDDAYDRFGRLVARDRERASHV